MKKRCAWCGSDPLSIDYHDREWGTPLHDDRALFEMLCLEGMQAGLSWITILKKRENYRQAFYQFDAEKIIRYAPRNMPRLLTNQGIIRNRLKIAAIINNAKIYRELEQQGQSFASFIWQFTDFKTIQNHWPTTDKIPAMTPLSDELSKALKKLGFKFVGSTICYAYMQAIGMVNDHVTDCFRYQQLATDDQQ